MQSSWSWLELDNEESRKYKLKLWLQRKQGDPYKAQCKIFAKDISLKVHGFNALVSHASGDRHKDRSPKDGGISSFLRKPENVSGPSTSEENGSQRQSTILTCTNKPAATHSEIMWCLE